MTRLLPSCVVASLCVLLGMCGLLQFARAAETLPEVPAADQSDGAVPDPCVVYDGSNGPGAGKHIVLVSGDEEYRSEEALPQLGKMLATHHGFKCTVLFAVDPATGVINPDNTHNIPGLEALRSADLMIIATRFRDLPDEQMKYVAEYLDAGKPVIGMRAAVVAFRLTSPTYERFSSRSRTWKGGFGRQILGQTWMSHHGRHGRESTRGLIAPGAEDHPIVRGCDDVWGPTDVYEVRDTLREDSDVLMLGQILEGMQPTDKPLAGPKNDPMMPMAWTRSYRGVNGTVGRVFTTTMGAATDLESEGFRRLLVNATYWCVGLEEKIAENTNVETVGRYKPTPFGFDKYKRGMKPSDHAVDGKGPAMPAPSSTTTDTLKDADAGGKTQSELSIGVDPSRPNIVYFFVDDMGWQDTSVAFHTEVTLLNNRYHTPNMEKLAAQGMKFTQAYACAVCSPSRVSLMTGLNAARHGVTNWTLRKNRSPDRNHPKIQPPAWNLNGLSAEAGVERTVHAVTLPMLLRGAGYRTIHAGKGHFGAKGTPGENPLNLGFDVNIAGHAAGGPGSYHGKNNFSAAFRRGDRIWDIPGLESYHGTDTYLNEALTIEANKAVEQAVADGKPFYLYMSHYAVHAPWEPDDRFLEKYTQLGLKGLPAVFASMIESMDKSLGDIMANLDRLGVADRTIVVFMSDNGCPSQLPRNLPLRGHKITPYEGGTRVPLIVKWPKVVQPGTTCHDYLIIEDIFPTFLEMAGVTKYEQIGGIIDGVSFVPLLKQKPPADPDRPIFWHFPNTYDQPPYSSVRKGDWKLIYQHIDRRLELYHLKEDIGEKHNLAASEPQKLRELANTLTEFLRSAKAPMPVDKTTGKIVEYPSEAP